MIYTSKVYRHKNRRYAVDLYESHPEGAIIVFTVYGSTADEAKERTSDLIQKLGVQVLE